MQLIRVFYGHRRVGENGMILPESLRHKISERLQEARARFPAALSDDGRALLVDGGPGYGAYVSPDGDVFMETYEWVGNSPAKIDRSERAQVMALVLGSRLVPELATLLPSRPPGAIGCQRCGGEGWRRVSTEFRFICSECAGLGWVLVGATAKRHEGRRQP